MNKREFVAALRTALMQLDDFESLRHSPLASLLSDTETPLTPFALQQFLLTEIEALAGAADVPPRFWDVLYFRFVNQLNQDKVAYQFGIGVRQLRRLQNSAVEFLAERLATRCQLDQSEPLLPVHNSAIKSEIAWLREEYANGVSHVAAELRNALQDASPLISRYQVSIECAAIDEEALATVPPQILRQALLTILTSAIVHAGPNLILSLVPSDTDVRFVVKLARKDPAPLGLLACQPALATVIEMLSPFNAGIQIEKELPQAVVLTLPIVESVPVLVLDDNPDTRHLFHRYVTNTCYRLILMDDAREAINIAQQQDVRALVLDIMMFETTGWDLLSEWRHHPATKDIPVAVCTILPQAELSYLLGAKAFLQKPVTQKTFLQLLGSLTGVSTRTSD